MNVCVWFNIFRVHMHVDHGCVTRIALPRRWLRLALALCFLLTSENVDPANGYVLLRLNDRLRQRLGDLGLLPSV